MPDGVLPGVKVEAPKGGITANVTLPSGMPLRSRYRPRVIHVNPDVVKKLIGVASHLAWKELMKQKAANINDILNQKGTPLMKVDFQEHKNLTSRIMKQLIWQLVSPYIK